MPTDLAISELFYSIQGESTYAGLPCLFIRLAGCNLRCSYCDAKYTYEEKKQSISLIKVMQYVDKYPNTLVEITGGEPLLQESVYLLIDMLINSGRTVLLETNGSVNISKVPKDVVKILDIKCPGSSMEDKMLYENLSLLHPHDQIKFVLSSRNDYDWALDIIKKYKLFSLHDLQPEILFSPIADQLEVSQLSDWILTDQLPVRLQIQLHKVIWPDCDRGV